MNRGRIPGFGRKERSRASDLATDDSASDVLVQITLPMVIVLAVWTLALAREAQRKREDIQGLVGPTAQREHVELIQDLQRMRLLKALEQYLAEQRTDLGFDALPAGAIVDPEGQVDDERFKLLATKGRESLGEYAAKADNKVVSHVYDLVLATTGSPTMSPIVDCARLPGKAPGPPLPCATKCLLAPLTADAPNETVEAVHRTHREGQQHGREEILERNRVEICDGIVRGLGALYRQITSVQDRVTNELAGMYIRRGIDAYRKLFAFNPHLKTVSDSLARNPTEPRERDPVFEQLRVALRCQLHCQQVAMLSDEPGGDLTPCAPCPGIEGTK